MSKRTGFSLIELLAVTVLLSLLGVCGLVMIRYTLIGPQVGSTVASLQIFDSSARVQARSGEQVQLVIDCRSNTIEWTRGSNPSNVVHRVPLVETGLQLRSLWLQGRREPQSLGRISYSSAGTTKSFALCLVDRKQARHWRLFLGLTGEMIPIQDDQLDRLTSILATEKGTL